jgi:hypothetical protein
VASSGIQRSGSALDVIADAATEEAITLEILKFEGQSEIGARSTEAALLTKEAGRINPMLAGASGAFGGFVAGGGASLSAGGGGGGQGPILTSG